MSPLGKIPPKTFCLSAVCNVATQSKPTVKCSRPRAIHPHTAAKLGVEKRISQWQLPDSYVQGIIHRNIFPEPPFRSRLRLSQHPVSHHVKCFIRLEWDPNSRWVPLSHRGWGEKGGPPYGINYMPKLIPLLRVNKLAVLVWTQQVFMNVLTDVWPRALVSCGKG